VAAATLFYPWWHYEVESLLVLKNNKGTESNRVRHMDYAIQLNSLIYERYIKNQEVTLFSPSANNNLYEYFFNDQEKFKEIYERMEAGRHAFMHKTISAHDLIHLALSERAATGRIYVQNVDHCNNFGPFDQTVAPIYMSNLCLEIALPTKPMVNIFDKDDDGEIALCTLAAANLGVFNDSDHSHFEEDADLLVEALDNLLDYQDYPVHAAAKNKKRRTLGIGIINYSYWLAKHRARYSDGSGKNITHRLMEAFQYYLLKASNKLAIEKGPCELFHETKYAQGSMPVDRYKADVDNLHSEPLHMDWDSLRESIKKFGLRNSTLTALMPSETSSIISSATNGIEPQRGAISVKSSKDGSMKCIVPEYAKLKSYYEFVWDIPNNIGYLSLVAIMQKFIDQAVSANTNYDPKKYPNELVPMKELVRDLFFVFKHGLKTMYYHNTRDNRGKSTEEQPLIEEEIQEDDGCSSGACKI
jgi:ribonucleoside-diphosphate reductase alpha chain